MFAGLDIGLITTKWAIINEGHTILYFFQIPTGYDRQESGAHFLGLALEKINKLEEQIKYVVSTGYGRRPYLGSNKVLTEIVCSAKGTYCLFPMVRTIIYIGGQYSKVIEMDQDGIVSRFEMNDKCAAVAERFSEVLSGRMLNLNVEDLGPLSLKARHLCTLTSVCTVFAESEIISLLLENKSKEDIACGLHQAIAKRVASMGAAGQIDYAEPIVFSGGVAKNIGVLLK